MRHARNRGSRMAKVILCEYSANYHIQNHSTPWFKNRSARPSLAKYSGALPGKASWKAYVISQRSKEPGKLTPKAECIYAWTHHSWNHIAAFFLFHLIPALVQYILVYTYYRQTIDPMHHANLLDERFTAGVPSPSFRRTVRGGYSRIETNDHDGMTTARLHHGPTGALTPRQRRAAQQAPYSKRMTTSNENYIGSNNMSIAPEANPGLKAKRPFVSCGIQRSHRPPPLISSPSPLGLNSTPGAPTYNRRPSRVYAAFAAPVASAEYDKFV